MKRDGTKFVLGSGRTFYAHGGILGLNDDEPGRLFHGYDGEVQNDDAGEWDDNPRLFTDAERREIASHMITLWARWGRIP